MFTKFEMRVANALLWLLSLSLWGGLACWIVGLSTDWARVGFVLAAVAYVPFVVKIVKIARIFTGYASSGEIT